MLTLKMNNHLLEGSRGIVISFLLPPADTFKTLFVSMRCHLFPLIPDVRVVVVVLFQRPSKNFESWSSPRGFTSSRSHRFASVVPTATQTDRPTAHWVFLSKDGWAPSWPLFYFQSIRLDFSAPKEKKWIGLPFLAWCLLVLPLAPFLEPSKYVYDGHHIDFEANEL